MSNPLAKLVDIYVAEGDGPHSPKILVRDVDGAPIGMVTRLELAIDAVDMVLEGKMTRVPEPVKQNVYERITTNIVVRKIVALDDRAWHAAAGRRLPDMSYPEPPQESPP